MTGVTGPGAAELWTLVAGIAGWRLIAGEARADVVGEAETPGQVHQPKLDWHGGQIKDSFGAGSGGFAAACWCLTESGGCFGGLAHAQLPGDGECVDGAADADNGAQSFVDLTARAGRERAGRQPLHDLFAFARVLEQAGKDLCLTPPLQLPGQAG